MFIRHTGNGKTTILIVYVDDIIVTGDDAEDRTIKAFTDADWTGSVDDRRSTSRYCTLVWGNMVTCRSRKQNLVARSSAEAEYQAMAHGVCESAIHIAHNSVQDDRTKHVEVDMHFIKEKIDGDIITIKHVLTGQQLVDVLTKGLSEKQFSLLLDKLGLTKIYCPA
ncbi:hypothetical protein LIER_16658 [Lithospermum erythrorhizon]|uniref:Uncharacterized protein n=1 Tax=Lithospermum erythrorhizon TaxID=34254 RepID=A0AAV3QCW7_LITER